MEISNLYDELFGLKDSKCRVFKVKIIKSSNPSSWYFSKTGDSFDVIDEGEDLKTVILYPNGKYLEEGFYIKKEDAEIVNV